MNYILYDYYSPAFRAGGPIQSLQNLVEALQMDIDLAVVCSNKDVDGRTLAVKTNLLVNTAYGHVLYSTSFYKYFQQLTAPGSIFINGLYSLHYNLLPLLFLNGRKVISVRGMLTEGGLKRGRVKKQLYISFLKMIGTHHKCEFHATNQAEALDIRRVFGDDAKIWVISNIPKQCVFHAIPAKQAHTIILVTVALISGMKNHLTILTALKQCKANVIYHIYGAVKERNYWDKCVKLIRELPKTISVTYHGEIEPDLVADVIANAHVYIQPSVAENFGHSLYEALAIGRPIITSTTTPWQGLQANKAGMNVRYDDINGIANAIDFFSDMSGDELRNWSLGARSYALSKIDVEKIKKEYLEMFRGVDK